MPNNLCTYFWKSVLLFIVLIPYLILSLPIMLIIYLNNDDGSEFGTITRPFVGVIIWAVLYIILAMGLAISIFWWEGERKSFWGETQFLGVVFWIVGGILGIIFSIEYFIKRRIKRRRNSEPSSNILTEFVKAKYHRYCPKLEWDDDNIK